MNLTDEQIEALWVEHGLDECDPVGFARIILAAARAEPAEPKRLWLWKNFANGRPEYWAFDNAFPIHLDDGDPQTMGEPCGYALLKPSRDGRPGFPDDEVLRRIAGARAEPAGGRDELDAERLDWLMHHISGVELRRLGIVTSAGCDRSAIDAARASLAAPPYQQPKDVGVSPSGPRSPVAGLPAIADAACEVPAVLLDALRFYARQEHMVLADPTAWDTVSGEPQNFWCDEAGTATVEDGSIAAFALRGVAVNWSEDDDEGEAPGPIEGEVFRARDGSPKGRDEGSAPQARQPGPAGTRPTEGLPQQQEKSHE